MKLKKRYPYLFIIVVVLCFTACNSKKEDWKKKTLLFSDNGSSNWEAKWTLDGLQSKVKNTKNGMELYAGTEYANDSAHTVLWTKQNFKGNLAIEYEYTRLDTTTRCVNILYFHAQGKGTTEYPTDISLWQDKRQIPSMSSYFNTMNTYHISYAAFSANEYSANNDYIRLRRYNPEQKGLKDTDVPGEYIKTGLFKTNVTYKIQVIKYNSVIEMHIHNKNKPEEKLVCKWDASIHPLCESGRIGLRHMYTRNSRYSNFKVWQIE